MYLVFSEPTENYNVPLNGVNLETSMSAIIDDHFLFLCVPMTRVLFINYSSSYASIIIVNHIGEFLHNFSDYDVTECLVV